MVPSRGHPRFFRLSPPRIGPRRRRIPRSPPRRRSASPAQFARDGDRRGSRHESPHATSAYRSGRLSRGRRRFTPGKRGSGPSDGKIGRIPNDLSNDRQAEESIAAFGQFSFVLRHGLPPDPRISTGIATAGHGRDGDDPGTGDWLSCSMPGRIRISRCRIESQFRRWSGREGIASCGVA